jgi:hypothetical protein
VTRRNLFTTSATRETSWSGRQGSALWTRADRSRDGVDVAAASDGYADEVREQWRVRALAAHVRCDPREVE